MGKDDQVVPGRLELFGCGSLGTQLGMHGVEAPSPNGQGV